MKKNCKNCIYGQIQTSDKLYKNQEIIFLEADELNHVYSINDGYVKMTKFMENGDEYVIGVLGPGDYLALLAVLQGKETYIASAVCLSDVSVNVLSKDDVLTNYRKNPKFKDLCLNCAVTRSNLFQQQMLISANSDISEKILDILKQLSYKFGEVKDKKIIIDLPFSKTVLAGIINIRRETLSRYLSQLQKEKILLVNKNQYILNYVI
jgi:CRP-like cAMP-binding protein